MLSFVKMTTLLQRPWCYWIHAHDYDDDNLHVFCIVHVPSLCAIIFVIHIHTVKCPWKKGINLSTIFSLYSQINDMSEVNFDLRKFRFISRLFACSVSVYHLCIVCLKNLNTNVTSNRPISLILIVPLITKGKQIENCVLNSCILTYLCATLRCTVSAFIVQQTCRRYNIQLQILGKFRILRHK